MTKIKFGDQNGDTFSDYVFIVVDGESEINVGNLYNRSVRSVRIVDLRRSQDSAILAKELTVLRQEIEGRSDVREHKGDLDAIREAARRAENGAGKDALGSLRKASKWVFDIATKIGVPVATAAIKTSLGL